MRQLLTYNVFQQRSSNGCAGLADTHLVRWWRRESLHLERHGCRGGQNKLSTEDQLLIVLEYWREYRSQFHIATSWRLHETTVGRIIKKVENLLVKCGKFRLPSKRHLYQPGWEWSVLMVDVGEMEIERPKKNKNATTLAFQSVTR